MAAGVSLQRAIEAVGHQKARGTHTREIIAGLRALGVGCADRLRRVSRAKPLLPPFAVVAACRIRPAAPALWHWLLVWDGVIYDPGQVWPDAYKDWRFTSYLELFPNE